MILTHQVEKKTPLTVLEAKVNGKSFLYTMESDSVLEDCLEGLKEITDHILHIKKDLEEKACQEAVEGTNG